jgi:enamine deaminase RidA (YjgF/YER057c/UK114 family)
MEEELKQVLNNIDLILKEADSGKDKILKVTIYINDLDQWGAVDQAYSDFFGKHTPARSIVALPKLHYGFKVEIDAIASC